MGGVWWRCRRHSACEPPFLSPYKKTKHWIPPPKKKPANRWATLMQAITPTPSILVHRSGSFTTSSFSKRCPSKCRKLNAIMHKCSWIIQDRTSLRKYNKDSNIQHLHVLSRSSLTIKIIDHFCFKCKAILIYRFIYKALHFHLKSIIWLMCNCYGFRNKGIFSSSEIHNFQCLEFFPPHLFFFFFSHKNVH